MTDSMQPAPIAGVPLSTTIDQGVPLGTGGGKPSLTEDAPKPDAKPETAGDTLKGELERIRSEEAKEVKAKGEDAVKDAKTKVDDAEKAEKDKPAKGRAEDGKFAKAKTDGDEPDVDAKADKGEPEKAATERAETDKRQSEGRNHEPPARFLPKAKEVWANVPHAVKGEIARMSQEHEAEATKYREASERYEPIREYDEIAKSNGRQLKDSLAKMVEVEKALSQNPITGLEAVLREVGPRKADGSHLSLMDVLQYVSKNPDAYQQAVNQPRQQTQQRQPDPEVQALKQELLSMRQEQTVQSIIAPFARENPRYHELEEDIAMFLTAPDKIPASLSPQERLEAAYDMAVRINPTSSVAPSQAREALAVAKNVPSDDAGAKSIRGAPNGQDPDEGDDETDIRKLLKREARKLAS